MAKKSMLADSTAQKIKSMIEGGDFSVGDKLPNENDFASQLGVSRSTLREAIRTLTASGMLEIKPLLPQTQSSSRAIFPKYHPDLTTCLK